MLLQGELGRIAPVLRGALGKLEHWVSWGERTLTRCKKPKGSNFPASEKRRCRSPFSARTSPDAAVECGNSDAPQIVTGPIWRSDGPSVPRPRSLFPDKSVDLEAVAVKGCPTRMLARARYTDMAGVGGEKHINTRTTESVRWPDMAPGCNDWSGFPPPSSPKARGGRCNLLGLRGLPGSQQAGDQRCHSQLISMRRCITVALSITDYQVPLPSHCFTWSASLRSHR